MEVMLRFCDDIIFQKEKRRIKMENKFNSLTMNLRKCLNHFEATINESREMYAKSTVEKFKELNISKEDLEKEMSPRDKAMYWMGMNQGLSRATDMLAVSKSFAKEGGK